MDRVTFQRVLATLLAETQRVDGALSLLGEGRSPEQMRDAAAIARRHTASLHALLDAAQGEMGVIQRRKLLRAAPVLTLGISAGASARLAAAHDVDDALIAAYQEVLDQASLAWQRADMARLYRAVRPIVERLTERLGSDMPDTRRMQLARLAAEASNLAGWNAIITGQRGRAREHYALAERAALAAGDAGLRAMAVEGLANLDSVVFFGGWARSRPALEGHRKAMALLDESAPPILRQWILSRLAHEMAAAGDEGFIDVLDEARGLEGAGNYETSGLYVPGGFWASGARLNDVEALGLAMLGGVAGAERLLHAEQEATPLSMPRRHAVLNISLAQVHITQGEPEQAARVATEALDVATGLRASLDVLRLRAIRERLRHWDLPAVREFDERLELAAV
jgi:hypothetical protein